MISNEGCYFAVAVLDRGLVRTLAIAAAQTRIRPPVQQQFYDISPPERGRRIERSRPRTTV